METASRDIRYFIAVAQAGSLTAAAQTCCVTEATLSKSVARLEEAVGLVLFERSKNGMLLTPAGKAIHGDAMKIMLAHEDLAGRASNLRQGHAGLLRVGATKPIFDDVLVNCLFRMVDRFPDIQLNFTLDIGAELIALLQQGHLDIVFSPLYSVSGAEVDIVPIGSDELSIVARKHHPIFNLTPTPKDLLRYGWILPRQNARATMWLNERFISCGLAPPRPSIEIDYVGNSIHRLVETTDLLLLRVGARNYPGKDQLLFSVHLPEFEFERPAYAIVRAGSYWSPGRQFMLDTVLSHFSRSSCAPAAGP
ncbi:Cyn operon transcriptional activator [Variovorax sp. SRS16]|uniref:LysR family transcriptional regulator n=1 Tax=Variovorax sp. SRS16 TaxID=282217 RepID=UPI001315E294|nr:LysR family transcriptional regulator [Variovorax sp. SRS16]VTU32408.1 Cyn operon transcriptional activator [Variovorax sp. SRS16]